MHVRGLLVEHFANQPVPVSSDRYLTRGYESGTGNPRVLVYALSLIILL